MKFGDTLYQRSVPKWAAYNVNYNEIKQLIKVRTSSGLAVPVAIPTTSSSTNRVDPLEDELFDLIKAQHDNVFLFLKSKYGELDRRIDYLERQVKNAQRAAQAPTSNSSLRERRHHKLLEDAESIGDDIQSLTRYASVQKTAFRKILKKHRKWTGSTALQTRLDNDLFSTGQLNLDYAHPLERVSTLKKTIIDELQAASDRMRASTLSQSFTSSRPNSTTSDINAALEDGPMSLDAALATIPYGKSSGSAAYWIHPDNLDEAEALLLRHVREAYKSAGLAREDSATSLGQGISRSNSTASVSGRNHIAYFDNAQRFLHDQSTNRPSKIAMCVRWCPSIRAAVTLSNLAPANPSGSTLNFKRKELANALSRNDVKYESSQQSGTPPDKIRRVREYMSEHRDVKPLAESHSQRTRYVGNSNSSQVGTWALLDTDIVISPYNSQKVGLADIDSDSGETFPHAVLQIRWEFSHLPEIVRAFDSSHLAERVHGFSLESAAVHLANKDLIPPTWKKSLERDIRKVPIALKLSTGSRSSTTRGRATTAGTSSATSSDGGQSESVFSTQQGQSSATSDSSPEVSTADPSSPTSSKPLPNNPRRKERRARIDRNAASPNPRQNRYWNEFDDGDEDVNPHEEYTIYVNPDSSAPGMETVSKVVGAIYHSLDGAKARMTSIFTPPRTRTSRIGRIKHDERRGLLSPVSAGSTDDEADLTDSDTTPTQTSPILEFGTFPQHKSSTSSHAKPATYYRANQILTPRQEALERTYLLFYSGLLMLSYMLLFISGILLSAGRKKKIFQVDIAVSAGIAAAETCAALSLILICMRRSRLGIIHWALVGIAISGVVAVGICEIIYLVGRQP